METFHHSSSRRASASRKLGAAWVVALLATATVGCQYTAQGKNASGVQLYQSGQYQQAAQQFHSAITQDPKNADGYYNLASAYHQIGRLNRSAPELDYAEQLYNASLNLKENNQDCYRALAVLLVDKNQPEKAQSLLNYWQSKFPTNPAPKVELARLREEVGDRKGAKEYLQQALAIDPYDVRALGALGRLQELEGDTAQALANYQRSLYRDQFQPELAARAAQLRTALNVQQNVTTPPGGTRQATTPNGALR